MKKKFLSVVLASVMAMSMIGCGSSAVSGVSEQAPAQTESTDAAQTTEATETTAEAPATTDSGDKKITVGATPVPHAEILDNIVKEVLAEDGWELETVVFSDYVLPNTSLEQGELDANYFQTLGYMNQQNSDAGLHLATYPSCVASQPL